MAGKHVGNSVYVPTRTHPPELAGTRENRAWAEGYAGLTNTHTVGTPEYLAHVAGAAATRREEAAGPAGTEVVITAFLEIGYEPGGGAYTERPDWSQVGKLGSDVAVAWGIGFDAAVLQSVASVNSAVLTLNVLNSSIANIDFSAWRIAPADSDSPADFVTTAPSAQTVRATAAVEPLGAGQVPPNGDWAINITQCINDLKQRAGWNAGSGRINLIGDPSQMPVTGADDFAFYSTQLSPVITINY